ncbi:alpha-1,2-mannosidase [Terrimicrobium sacchariphilum]|uniref:Alpha-1,2-mannosidase n=1 Tax=Terrimicrobium sacchariphilum TaxID=690879 RepID=A0A146G5J4_TERSA|nr:GH92 family glycosyl hydrolase [Terrimicrobium sacchariphilum]GAT32870.1 alpha-1,2-mannosidase [Terrimicrobium sacchariphilum]
MTSLVDLVNPLQGTTSDKNFSTGNTLPITSLPFGLHHWSLQTREDPWFFHPGDRKLWGIRLTHQPSPWMLDYGALLVSAFHGPIAETPALQSSAYRIVECRPHVTRLQLPGQGIDISLAPAPAGLLLVFETRSEAPLKIRLSFRQEFSVETSDTLVHGRTTDNSGGVPEGFGLSFCGRFSDRPRHVHSLPNGTCWEFAPGTRRVELRLAASFIDGTIARYALASQLDGHSFSEIEGSAAQTWDALLGRLDFPDPEDSRRRTFYSCLYRTLLFPRLLTEKDPSGNDIHYSPYDGAVHTGPLCTDNGFWDTYRTVYPLLAHAFPDQLTTILQGWLNACKQAGWTPKWPSPGLKDCMIGTHFDAVAADAVARGITGWDVEAVFPFLWRNATEQSSDGRFGRQGLEDFIQLGYLPADRHRYSVSATLDYAYGDFCVMQVARHLGRTREAELLSTRIGNYRNVFDPSVGFMRERNSDGSWLRPFGEFRWGGGFIEGGPWQHSFHVPHDIPGLASLFGGEAALEAKLDAMLSTPPLFQVGHYGFEIHEMTEMAMAGFGQYAHSNQPVHGYLFLYALLGQPEKTSHWVRKVCDELYGPEKLPGDEDNGEMSAWYIWANLGLFPHCPGRPGLVSFQPPHTRASVRRDLLP